MPRDDLVLHISQVVLDFADADSDDVEWGLHAAVDLRNSLPYEKVVGRLVKLNLRVDFPVCLTRFSNATRT